MPQLLESFEFKTGRNGQKYDYDSLFDGRIWKLIPGEDFDANSAQAVAGRMYAAARVRGLRAKCHVNDDGTLVLQAFHWDAKTPADQPRPHKPDEENSTTAPSSDEAAA